MPYYMKNENGGVHIAYTNTEVDECSKHGYELIEDYDKYCADRFRKSSETPAFLAPVDKEPETATIEEQVKRKPGRKPRITE